MIRALKTEETTVFGWINVKEPILIDQTTNYKYKLPKAYDLIIIELASRDSQKLKIAKTYSYKLKMGTNDGLE